MQLTPREIVEALDKYIVGQDRAKRAVAVALLEGGKGFVRHFFFGRGHRQSVAQARMAGKRRPGGRG